MDIYKHICKQVVIPLWARWEKSPYLKHLSYLEQSQYFSREQIRDIQWRKIKKILDHAYHNCSYYKERFDHEHVHPDDIKTFDDFASLPLLTKDDVRGSVQGLLAPSMDRYASFLTSGSTGIPISGFRNKECNEFKRACAVRSNFWAGCDLGDRIYCLYGNPEKELRGFSKFRSKIRRKYLNRTEILDMLSLTEESMLAFAGQMQRKPPSLLWGHAHGLYLLSNILWEKGIRDIRPRGIYSAGMVLHDWERKKVEEVFQCKLQDRYGCEELGLIASECKEQQGLHINTDDLYVEFLGKDGKQVKSGDLGFIVITDLSNLAMPFIRYRMEDLGVYSQEQCRCGRTQPMIKRIEGRIADFLITPERKMVSGISLTDHFAGHIPGITQIQIVQEKTDMLILNVVKSDDFGKESEQAVTRLVKDFFGEKMRFQYSFMDKIPQGPRGKYQFTVCKVKHDLI
jgi:phenylacetate-CoA ligase